MTLQSPALLGPGEIAQPIEIAFQTARIELQRQAQPIGEDARDRRLDDAEILSGEIAQARPPAQGLTLPGAALTLNHTPRSWAPSR
jgi:hypothetical protein